MAFGSRSFSTITSHYPVPNNHILHSLLMRASSLVFGDGETALRLPALVAGVLGIPAAWWLARGVSSSPWAAGLAAWVLALAPVHVGYSHMARGYSLLVLLTAVAGGALLRARPADGQGGGDRRWWAPYALALFLALYTQPSAALLAVALGLWSLHEAVRARDRDWIGATLMAHGAVLAASAWAYGPILDRVLAAGQIWGIDLHEGSFLAFGRLFVGTAGALGGGWLGVPVLALAGFGAVALARTDRSLRNLALSLALVPLLLPLVHGTAPQPRGYLFLLPWMAVAAGMGCLNLTSQRRWLAAGIVLTGLAATTLPRAVGHQPDARWRDLGATLSSRTPRGEILVAPYIMDVEVFHYAKPAIQRGLVTTLMDGASTGLLFAARRGSPNFELSSYRLAELMTRGNPTLHIPESKFDLVYEDDALAVYRLLSRGQAVMPASWQWNAHPDQVAGIQFGASGAAVSERRGLAIGNEGGRPFRLYSDARFQAPTDGLCLLVAARSVPQTSLSLYAVQAAAPGVEESVTELPAIIIAPQPVKAVGRDGQLWHLEAFLHPVAAGGEYGVYLQGSAAARQDVADIQVYHFPWP